MSTCMMSNWKSHCIAFFFAATISVVVSLSYPVKSGSYVGELTFDSSPLRFPKILTILEEINYNLHTKMTCEIMIETESARPSEVNNTATAYIYVINSRGPEPEYELKASPTTLKCLDYATKEIQKNIIEKASLRRSMEIISFQAKFTATSFFGKRCLGLGSYNGLNSPKGVNGVKGPSNANSFNGVKGPSNANGFNGANANNPYSNIQTLSPGSMPNIDSRTLLADLTKNIKNSAKVADKEFQKQYGKLKQTLQNVM